MCTTVVLIGRDPATPPPRICAHIRGRKDRRHLYVTPWFFLSNTESPVETGYRSKISCFPLNKIILYFSGTWEYTGSCSF